MGAQLRVFRRRIRSVQATKKITKAMELIASSRIVKAQQRLDASMPYLTQLVDAVSAAASHASDVSKHPLTATADKQERAAVLIITADRGLAGAYSTRAVFRRERRRPDRPWRSSVPSVHDAVDGRAPRVGLGQRPQHLLGPLHLLELLRDAAGRRRPVGRAAVREERAQRGRRRARRRLPRRRLDERRAHGLEVLAQPVELLAQQLIMRWAMHSVAELQEFVEAFGLPTSGAKSELVSRLEASTVAEHVDRVAMLAVRTARTTISDSRCPHTLST